MVYHSLRRAVAKISGVFSPQFWQTQASDRLVGLGIQGLETDIEARPEYDPYVLEENGFFGYVPPTDRMRPARPRKYWDEPYPVRRFTYRQKKHYLGICEVALLFGLLFFIGFMSALWHVDEPESARISRIGHGIDLTNNTKATQSVVSPTHLVNLTFPSQVSAAEHTFMPVPGFYLMLGANSGVSAALDTTTDSATEPFVQHGNQDYLIHAAGNTAGFGNKLLNDEEKGESCEISAGPIHRSYPIHATKLTGIPGAMKFKVELEDCAQKLLRKLANQGIESTRSFEFALQNCKFTIDATLNALYPPIKPEIRLQHYLHTHQSGRNPSLMPSRTDSKPHPAEAAQTGDECEFKRPKSILSGRVCSKQFCQWASRGNLDRCYEVNKTWTADAGGARYLNDSIDDFKTNAPVQCNLCLPAPDCKGIDEHCQGVEDAEKLFMSVLLYLLAVLLVLPLVFFLGKLL